MRPLSHPSPNFDQRPKGITPKWIVIHHTVISLVQSLRRLCDAQEKVSAHYLIDTDGKIYSLVDDEHRAWHAGKAFWQGVDDINGHSLGVELVNSGVAEPFADEQMLSLIMLMHRLCLRWHIDRRNVLGHADAAPTRKDDPGVLFSWQKLADYGFGLWVEVPTATGNSADLYEVAAALAQLGYDTSDKHAACLAFQRHFRPNELGKQPDVIYLQHINALILQRERAQSDMGSTVDPIAGS